MVKGPSNRARRPLDWCCWWKNCELPPILVDGARPMDDGDVVNGHPFPTRRSEASVSGVVVGRTWNWNNTLEALG